MSVFDQNTVLQFSGKELRYMENMLINLLLPILAAEIVGAFVSLLKERRRERITDPIHNFRLLKGRIETALVFYKNKYATLVNTLYLDEEGMRIYHEAARVFRLLAIELRRAIVDLPTRRGGLPSNEKILEASSQLIGLSNNIPCVAGHGVNMCRENREHEEEIRKLLGLQSEKW